MLVRTWNVFHGNTYPPQRRAFLREMIELVTARRAGRRLPPGAPALGAPAPRALERHARGERRRAAVAASRAHGSAAGSRRSITVFCAPRSRARRDAILARAPFVEPRVGASSARVGAAAGRARDPARRTASSSRTATRRRRRDQLAARRRLRRRRGARRPRRRLQPRRRALRPRTGFSEPLAGSIDQILVRGLPAAAARRVARRPAPRRQPLLSDHAPVELTVG